MPLDVSGLRSALTDLATNPPGDFAQAASAWGDAMSTYAAAVVPASTTVAAAQATLVSSLATAFPLLLAAPAAIEQAFLAFGATVGGGMLAAGFGAKPPTTPVGFASLVLTGSVDEGVGNLVLLIDTWMRTGLATNTVSGVTIPWS